MDGEGVCVFKCKCKFDIIMSKESVKYSNATTHKCERAEE